MKFIVPLIALPILLISCRTPNSGEMGESSVLADENGEDVVFRKSIEEFEALGGSGTWFKSTYPYRLGGKDGDFYLVKTLPAKPSRKAKILLLRTEYSLAALAAVSKLGAPIVLGNIPQITQVFAAAMGGAKLSDDTIALAKSSKKNIILITPDVSIFTLAHENRHWLDFEDKNFTKKLREDVARILTTLKIKKDWNATVVQIAIEMRGHIVQARQARKSLADNAPYIDRAGNIDTDPESMKSNYGFEAMDARNIFTQTYSPLLFEMTRELSKSQLQVFATAMAPYDSSDDPQNKITFRSVLGIR